jgi:hypothetical protein
MNVSKFVIEQHRQSTLMMRSLTCYNLHLGVKSSIIQLWDLT